MIEFYGLVGFMLAAYAVIANDSIQTLGTFINSTKDIVSWQKLWFGTVAILVGTLTYGWIAYNGDLSFGRLRHIPYQIPEWYHALAPALLLVLTRFGVPISTSFLVLSVFSTSIVLEKMFMKSVLGYVLATGISFIFWLIVVAIVKKFRIRDISEDKQAKWRIAQAFSTGFLWFTWIMHDMANITVFLPRPMPLWMFAFIVVVFISILAHIFSNGGGNIQRIVKTKTNTRFIISATIIDLSCGVFLYAFKELNDIPMSTTWVFVGLLTGREIAIRTMLKKKRNKRDTRRAG